MHSLASQFRVGPGSRSRRWGSRVGQAWPVLTVPEVELGPHGLGRDDVVRVARHNAAVRLAETARVRIEESAALVRRLAESSEPVYGVCTGFGSLATTSIPPVRREELQRALVRSHAAGTGPPVEDEVVRAMMVLRARTLAMGYSGVRTEVVET